MGMKRLGIFANILILANFSLSQDFWTRTGNLSQAGNDFVPAIECSLQGLLFAYSQNTGIFRSTNTGDNWNLIVNPAGRVSNLRAASNEDVFAISDNTAGIFVIRSTDNGLTWNQVYSAPHANNYFSGGDMVFTNSAYVSAVSYTRGPTLGDIGVEIIRSTNNGASWTLLHIMTEWGGVLSITRLNDGRIMAATTLNGIWYSSNNGSSWQQLTSFPAISTRIIKTNSTGNIFVGRNTAASSAELIFRSTDNGTSWQGVGLLSGGSGGDTRAIYSDNENKIYVSINTFGPTTRKVYRTTNNGLSWSEVTSGLPPTQLVYSLTGNTQNIIFAGTGSNGVYRGSTKILGINENEIEIPHGLEVEQNYPNPFNSSTNIRFKIPSSNGTKVQVKLSLYNLIGQTVATLVDEELRPGKYEVSWDGTNYTSGVYFYILSAEGFTAAKKMLQVK
jgi:type IX secretion system substrate protein